MPYFNSRPSARGDRADVDAACRHNISIHAPPRGATSAPTRRTRRRQDFNSRPSARGDHRFDGNGRAAERFQFTPLREGRRRIRAESLSGGHFNSRPSARGDAFSSAARKGMILISIHAPPRGATASSSALPSPSGNFNSRPSARGDAGYPARTAQAMIFQFTPLREGRRRTTAIFCI